MENSFKLRKAVIVFIICQTILILLATLNELVISELMQSGSEAFKSFQEKVLLVLFIAPIFETLIFNLLLNESFFKFIHNVIYCIILSSLFFSSIHYYSLSYIFFTFLAGLVFNSFYFWIRNYKGYRVATLCVFLLHFNHNLMGLFLGK